MRDQIEKRMNEARKLEYLEAVKKSFLSLYTEDADVEEKLQENKIHPRQIEGYQTASWILMDFNDVIVHIFNEEDRLFYNLEKIWLDGKVIDADTL